MPITCCATCGAKACSSGAVQFILVVRGELAPGAAVFGGVLPALAGNVLGGTGIFAALTFAQVREEI